MLCETSEIFSETEDLKYGYKSFKVEEGLVIVTNNPEISKDLKTNAKFDIYRTVGNVSIFNSKDISKKLIKTGGLNPQVLHCIIELFR